MFLLCSERLVVVQRPLHQVTIPLAMTFLGEAMVTLSHCRFKVVVAAVLVRETALIKVRLDVQSVDDLELDIAGAIEINVAALALVLILVLNRVTLVVLGIYFRKVRTIGVVNRINRQHAVCQHEVITVRSVGVRQRSRSRQADTQAVVDGALLELEAEAMALHVIVAHDTVAIQIGVRGTVVVLRTATRQGDGVILRNTCTSQLIEPIRVGTILVVHACIQVLAFRVASPLVGVHQVGLVGHLVESYITVITDLRLRAGTSLSRDQNNTTRRTRTVDSRRRGILQHGDRLDIGRSYRRHITTGDSIDNDQRTLVVL